MLGCLGGLWHAVPHGPGDDHGSLVVAVHLDNCPCGSAQAGGAALYAGAVVKDVAVERPQLAVYDFEPVLGVFNAAAADGGLHALAEVGAEAARKGSARGAAGQRFSDQVKRRNAGPGLRSVRAVALPDPVEH